MQSKKRRADELPDPRSIGCILQVNTSDLGGGAEKYSYGLMTAFRSLGYNSWMAVGTKRRDDLNVAVIPNKEKRPAYKRAIWALHDRIDRSGLPSKPKGLITWLLRRWAEPIVVFRNLLGFDYYEFPGTKYLSSLTPSEPRIVHFHNLHGGYFDLRLLPRISAKTACFLTLHDNWALTGYCPYTFGCERYTCGCGKCPELGVYRKLHFDGTGQSWQHKREIYEGSKLYIVTPSRWLMNMVDKSILNAAAVEKRVIPVGVDLSVYTPADKLQKRDELNLTQDANILVFASNGGRSSRYKDYATLRRAFEILCEKWNKPTPLIFVLLGEIGDTELVSKGELRFVPFQKEPSRVAGYYQAADLYVHAAHEDNFPAVIIEALACGTPAVATAVGGIPEQILGLRDVGHGDLNRSPRSAATGALVPPHDPEAFASVLQFLLTDPDTLLEMSANAVADVKVRFDSKTQIKSYLSWYAEVLQQEKLL
jgi:glycosyltransferase involved in cell wall biosynthesis